MHALATTVLASPLSPDTLIGKYGTIGLAVILFAECGLLIGFFLPGDTLLFSAGLLLATHSFKNQPPLAEPLVILPIAAILGNLLGYWIGFRAGPAVFNRPNSRIFSPRYVERSEAFFAKWGAVSVMLARFVPVVRTVATVLAGVSRMRFSVYAVFSLIGAVLWADGVLLIGYGLGKLPFIQHHHKTVTSLIDPVIIAVVVLSLVPVLVHYLRGRKRTAATDA
jgi:membrane-associated protein